MSKPCTLKHKKSIENFRDDLRPYGYPNRFAMIGRGDESISKKKRHNEEVLKASQGVRGVVDIWEKGLKKEGLLREGESILEGELLRPYQEDINNGSYRRNLLYIEINTKIFERLDNKRKELGIYDSKQSLSDYRKKEREEAKKNTIDSASQKQQAQTPKEVVRDLSGNTYSVNESDITTYETEFGPIRYIINENGDMVMLSDKNTGQDKQFQKLTEEEKAKTIEQVTKEHRSIAALKDLSAKLAYRIGGRVRFENRTDVDWKGYNQGMTSVLNEAYMTSDTPFHEILAHPIIRAIKNKHTIKNVETYNGLPFGGPEMSISNELTPLYKSLLKELETGRGKEVFEQVKRDYVNKDKSGIEVFEQGQDVNGVFKYGYKLHNKNNGKVLDVLYDTKEEALAAIEKAAPKYSLEEQQEEAIVTLLGLLAADKLDAKKDATLISKLKEFWKQISDFVRQLLLQDEIKIDELPITTTLNDLAEIMAYGSNKIILPGYKVEYSTPLGNKYDTLEEVNNEIKGLVDANVEVDLSNIEVNYAKTIDDVPKKNFVYYELADSFSGDTHEIRVLYNPDNKKGWFMVHPYEGELYPLKDKTVVDYYNNQGLKSFIEKNKEYEQSREIIEQWKKENNIQYDPEEVYSRGQGFYSSIGAYSNLELDLLLKNLIQHIQDNKKAGGEFTISAFTKPIDRRLKHIEGTGDRVRFVIYPQSEHIKWAAPTDVYSGSVWDAHEKVSKDKKSELLGVSFTKAPSLRNINEVSPNLADIIDNLSHVHNELGIELTTDNFRIEYDDNIDYSTKKLIDNINKILDDKYGKLEKPEIKKQEEKIVQYGLYSKGANDILDWFDTKEEAQAQVDKSNKQLTDLGESPDYSVRPITKPIGKQPTQTRENVSSIEDAKKSLTVLVKYYIAVDNTNGAIVARGTKEEIADQLKEYPDYNDYTLEEGEIERRDFKDEDKYTSQALTNLKVAALKEVARKYPRSLITSKVIPINLNVSDNSEIQYSKVNSNPSETDFQESSDINNENSLNKPIFEPQVRITKLNCQ